MDTLLSLIKQILDLLVNAPPATLRLLLALLVGAIIMLWAHYHGKVAYLKAQTDGKKIDDSIDDSKLRRAMDSQLLQSQGDIAESNILIRKMLAAFDELHRLMLAHTEITEGHWLPISALLTDIQKRMVSTDVHAKELLMRQNADLRRMSVSKDEIIAGLEERIRILTTKE